MGIEPLLLLDPPLLPDPPLLLELLVLLVLLPELVLPLLGPSLLELPPPHAASAVATSPSTISCDMRIRPRSP
jgi:hypothetical protein